LDAATLVLEVPLDLTLDIRHSSLDAYGQEELSLRDPREYQLTERAGTPRPRWHDGSCGRPRGHSQLLDHQPRRPWQVDAVGPHLGADPRRRPAGHEGPV